jgi:kumamolisin
MSDPTPKHYVSVPGSERAVISGARQIGPIDPNERIEVSVYLRSRSGTALADEISGQVARQRDRLTREEYRARHGADPADVAKVEAFAHEHGLSVITADEARRVVVLVGTAAAMQTAFGVALHRYEHQGGTYRGRSGAVQVPAELHGIVQAVLGLDDRPQAQPHLRRRAASAGLISYTPPQLATLYDFPTGGNGQGECIAIIELGGGYQSSDIQTYFAQLDITPPQVTSIGVDGGSNAPTGDPGGPDGEVALDIQVAGAIAPSANIAVYFAPNTDRGFLDAITTATHDTQNNPSVISISWGGPESNWTSQAMQAMDQAFQAAAALGLTVCCASGDSGSGDGVNDGLAHVDFPASSPHALACGGTQLEAQGTVVLSETAWNDGNGAAGGGGISDEFALPTWQANAHVPVSINPGARVGRGVPDVAGDADPQTGYQVLVDGQASVIGGTSAVAPLWAGLIALLNQQLGQPVGYLNPVLYQQLANSLRDVTGGNNGGYQARPGWDACTGLGTPDGNQLLNGLAQLSGKLAPAVVLITGEE